MPMTFARAKVLAPRSAQGCQSLPSPSPANGNETTTKASFRGRPPLYPPFPTTSKGAELVFLLLFLITNSEHEVLACRRNPTHGVFRRRAYGKSLIAWHAMAIRIASSMPHAPPGPARHVLTNSAHVPCASPGHRTRINLVYDRYIIV